MTLCRNSKAWRYQVGNEGVAVPGSQMNEHLLWHGLRPELMNRVLKNGFQPGFPGKNAGKLFGSGFYFTPHSSKADAYTDEFRQPCA